MSLRSINAIRSKVVSSHCLIFIAGLVVVFSFLYNVGNVPHGLFCDEALIGTASKQLIQGELSHLFIKPFFYRHFDYTLGMLHLVATAPFVAIGPLSDVAVRYASVFYSLSGLLVLGLILKRFKISPLVPLLLLAYSPLFFLVAHANFGHAISFLVTCVGLYAWSTRNESKHYWRECIAGLLIGLSMYGYTGYMLSAAILLFCLVIPEFFQHGRQFKLYMPILMLIASFTVSVIPFFYQLKTNPDFLLRFKDKFGTQEASISHVAVNLVKNYPKYFGIDELYLKGEQELPGGFVSRHSLKGHGMYLRMYAPILVLAFFAFLFTKDKKKWEFAPYFLLFLLSPLTDALTTNESRPPYPFALFPGLLSVPFITAYAQRVGTKMSTAIPQINQKLLAIVFVALLGLEISSVLVHFYRDYPQYSSDYWGWQYGPKEIVRYFKEHQSEYDQLLMTGYFNQPQALLDFYNFDGQCTKCMIGGITQFDPEQRQLFALRTEELSTISQKYVTKAVITLPNGNPAYSMIEITPE